ncbi:MAG: hypothetical protein HYZ79_00460 [Candidatus Melainabacteria bacterium]|nr:hypothetical protein [Candidatus Melainabacteria bacterium]
MRALLRIAFAQAQGFIRANAEKRASGVKDLLELSESEILTRLFTLDKPERLYTHEYAKHYVDPHPGEYGDSNGDPSSFLMKVRDKIVRTIAGGLELEGASTVSRSDFEKAIELTTMLSSGAELLSSGWNIYAIDQFTVGFDSKREAIYSAVEALSLSSDDATLIVNLQKMIEEMHKASALVIA